MASENETIAGIVAEIRARAGVWIAKELKQYDLRLADRIDAAWKREREKIAAETRQRSAADSGCPNVSKNTDAIIAQSAPVGNAAAMREALVGLAQSVQDFMATKGRNFYPDMAVALDSSSAALSAPARNCDVGTAEEQGMRYKAFCRKYFTPDKLGGNCRKCPLYDRRGWSCELAWAQMPYAAKEGAGND